MVGHPAGSTFTVSLGRGETYSVTSTSPEASRHLGGTQITSNKPIAVTISDDSIEQPGEAGCWDLIGDQLIPTSILGTEYIAMNTLYGQGISGGIHKVFLLAVEDGTFLYVNGDDHPKVELDQGEMHELDITGNALYLHSNKPFYAYQITGIPHEGPNPPAGTELGSAVLPNITCTGSSSVSFTRTLNQRFFVQLMTEESNRNSFQIEGPDDGSGNNPAEFLDDLEWEPVEGTDQNGGGEQWYTTTEMAHYQWTVDGVASPEDTLNITDANGCETTGKMVLNHLPSPDFSLGDDREKCDGHPIWHKISPQTPTTTSWVASISISHKNST